MIRNCYTYLIAFLLTNCLYSQQITVDNAVPLQQLIQDNLVEGCVEITNISSSINGTVNGLSSYGYFDRSSSNFPFANGIILATGDASSGGNTVNTNTLNDGDTSWGTDTDLENTLGITNTLNATSIEFDFVSISNTIQFNYILASEEYFGQYPCQYSDGFAFLIRPTASAGPYQNIALIPGTSIPVSTNTIHDEIVGFCPEENSQYFDGYNIGDTNYNGRTEILTATANITPYTQYHIKLIIADQTNQFYDSAVFIEGNSFSSVVDLGPDITTCADVLSLNADIQNNQATYSWYLNNSLLTGENNPTLNNITQSGTYRVEVAVTLNNTNCIIEDDIVINLSTEQSASPISDYELCDDASNDGIETFDLTTKDSEVLSAVPPANYVFSYHLTQGEAQSNSNAITTPIQNSSNPQTIYVRIEDIDTGCLAFTTINLIVNPFPNVAQNNLQEVCDTGDPDGITEIDLTAFDSAINNGQVNLAVTYHISLSDANQGINPISSPYTNTTAYNEQLYIRVLDTSTGCWTTASLTIDIIQAPPINTDTQYIDACDPEHDGFASFDLSTVIPEVLQGLTGVSTSFYTDYNDAITGTNPINNINNFDNSIFEEQTLFIRVEDDVTGCISITPIEVHPNLLLTGTNIQDFAFCDNDGDGEELINLTLLAAVIDGDIPDVVITFYESQSDLDNGVNPVDQNTPYSITDSHTFYITLENGSCSEQSEVTIHMNSNINFGPIAPISYCDTDDDGITSVDLDSLDELITNNPDLNIRYFSNVSDAENGINPLPNFYTPSSNPETIYVRIENIYTSCYTTNSFELTVIPAPSTNTPSDILICDSDSDGITTINLDDKITEIVTDTTNLTISFFTTEEDANAFTNNITPSNSFNTGSTSIWIRIESNITGCYALESFQITVNTLPVINAIDNFQLCEDDNDYTTDFLLIDKDLEILNGATDKEVFYFENATDANNNSNAIDKFNAYQNTSNPQTIFIRVENISDPTCYSTGSFTIEVAPNPIFNEPTDYILCDDVSNDGIDVFDLNDKIVEISQSSPDTLDISFFESMADAQNNSNALPLQYTNSNNPQQVYVRIQNQTYCTIITSFGINILPSPEVSESEPLTVCDDDMDGLVTFNLEDALFDILDVRQDDIEIGYYESIDDLEAEINPISTPSNYSNTSNPQTVYIRITNTVTLCYQAIPLDLIVNFPPAVNTIGTVEICDNATNTYDLTQVDSLVIDDTSNVTITYYETLNDAENASNPIIGDFNYIFPNTTLYVRIEDNSTGCFTTTSMVLQVNEIPFVNNPAPSMEDCDDNYDGLLFFNLEDNTPIIIGAQNVNDYSLTYYNSQADAESATNVLNPIYEAYDGEILYTRVENNETGCYYVTQFEIIIHPKPIIDLNDIIALCLDDVPLTVNASTNNAGDTYLWSTGETTAAIDIYPNELGDYWVIVTTPFGCNSTHDFSVIQSEIATINFTTTVDFADPNSITVDISGGGDYLFSLDHGPWQTSNIFEPVTLGLHEVTVRDANGCQDVSQEVFVIDVPLFVTPNNDGYFDTWHVVGIEQLPGTIVYIFDRYGKLLKTLSHTSLGWDGTYSGNPMPSDDYWFVADVKKDGNEFEVKGHFTLKR